MSPRTNLKPSPARALRESAGFTREQLAVKAGLSSTTIYIAERTGFITEATVAKLAAALDCKAEELRP